MTPIPTPSEVAQVVQMKDLAARNREVTKGYFRFSQRFRTYLGEEASWPTFAAWASAQAGRTIRKEDLSRALERRLDSSPVFHHLVNSPLRLAGEHLFQAVAKLDLFDRSSQAVAAGNIKVYAEIGLEFARFLELLEQYPGSPQVMDFAESLRAGPPPDGQDYLKLAFPTYYRAANMEPCDARSELILYANVCIGFHEQTRLQPEIEASLDGSALDAVELKHRLMEILLPQLDFVHAGLAHAVLIAKAAPLLAPLVHELQHLVREVVTETMMVIELPGELLRLGRDLPGRFSEALRTVENPELRLLLQRVDLTIDSLRETGVCDWTVFCDRMHYIADLFRSRQAYPRLFEEPS